MEEKDHNSIQVIDRTLDIIELLSTEQKDMGLTEISKRVELHKTTVYRILSTLLSRGYVERGSEKTYKMGAKLMEIASCHINDLELQTEARPFLWELSAKYNLVSHLGVLNENNVVYIEKLDAFTRLRLYAQVGYRVPAYPSSLGKCLISSFSETQLSEYMEKYRFVEYTKYTITDKKQYKAHLRKVRSQGWGMDNQEQVIGQRCIGAPIYDYRGEMIAAVSGSGVLEQIPDEKIEIIAEYIKNLGLEISKRLGYNRE